MIRELRLRACPKRTISPSMSNLSVLLRWRRNDRVVSIAESSTPVATIFDGQQLRNMLHDDGVRHFQCLTPIEAGLC